MQIWAESGKSTLPICNYSQILYQFLTFTQNLKRSQKIINEVLSKSAFPHYPINLLIFKSMQLILFSSVCCGIYKDCVPVKQGILQVERILSLFAQSVYTTGHFL